MPKLKLNCQDLSNRVWSVIKIKQDKDVIDHIGVIYTVNNNELLWSIGSGTLYNENHTRQQRDYSYYHNPSD